MYYLGMTMNKDEEKKILKEYNSFVDNLYNQSYLKNLFINQQEEMIEHDVDIDNLSKEAFIADVCSNNVCLSNNKDTYIDTYIEKIKYQVNIKYGEFKEEDTLFMYNPSDKEDYVVNEGFRIVMSTNMWFLFDFSDAVDYLYENKCKLVDKVAELNDLLKENVGDDVITFDINIKHLKYFNDKSIIVKLKEKTSKLNENEDLNLNNDEKEIWSFLQPLKISLSIDENNTLKLNTEDKENLNKSLILLLENFIKNETKRESKLVIKEIQSLREMKLTKILKDNEVSERKRTKI